MKLLALLLLLAQAPAPDAHQALAHRIMLALANDPRVVLEVRQQPGGSYRVVLDPVRVEGLVVRELEKH